MVPHDDVRFSLAPRVPVEVGAAYAMAIALSPVWACVPEHCVQEMSLNRTMNKSVLKYFV
jgi:hypothetical protein